MPDGALIAAAEGYWRAFQTNGTEDYHPAKLLPDSEPTGMGARLRAGPRRLVTGRSSIGFSGGDAVAGWHRKEIERQK